MNKNETLLKFISHIRSLEFRIQTCSATLKSFKVRSRINSTRMEFGEGQDIVERTGKTGANPMRAPDVYFRIIWRGRRDRGYLLLRDRSILIVSSLRSGVLEMVRGIASYRRTARLHRYTMLLCRRRHRCVAVARYPRYLIARGNIGPSGRSSIACIDLYRVSVD